MIKNILHPKKQRGFIILFAVTLASLLLSIALGIASVSYREVTFSTSAREANDAFLAADSGAECILSHDKQSSALPATGVSGPTAPNLISCGPGSVVGNVVFTTDVSTNTNTATYNFTIPNLGPSQNGCASVKLIKTNVAGLETFTMTSKGYNGVCVPAGTQASLHSVEREITLSSVAGASGASNPPSSTNPSITLTSNVPSVTSGGSVTLSWSTTGVSGCSASSVPSTGWSILPKTFGSGTTDVSGITSDTTFTLTCQGTATPASVTVTVTFKPTLVALPTSASVTTSTADLTATVSSIGTPAPLTARGICYNTAGSPTLTNGATCAAGTLAQTLSSYTVSVSGLSSNTTYKFAGYATNSSGTGYSPDGTFITQAGQVPTLTSPTVSAINSSGATLGANLTALGNPASVTARGVCWGLSAAPTANCSAATGTTTGVYTKVVTGMPGGTLIYYRGYAINSTGTGYSVDSTFTTNGAPTVASPTSASITSSGATLGATVTSLGGPASITARGVCYNIAGTPRQGGIGTTCVAGTLAQTLSPYTVAVSGLTAGTTYKIAGYATNTTGTGYSADGTFVTSPACTITGGTITTITGYRVHTFTTATSPKIFSLGCSKTVEYLVVAGGGGGGPASFSNSQGGGGGAGGMKTGSIALTSGSYNITVGSGGGAAVSGSGSSLSTLVSTSGGGRGASGDSSNGSAGGSGGGGGGLRGNLSGTSSGGSGVVGEGNRGGTGTTCVTTDTGAGGGGAGGNGNNGVCDGVGGSGGLGLSSSITGTATTYARGGAAPGGSSGSGTNNGNGGNGGANGGSGSAGQNGVVIIRYVYP